MSKLLRFDNWLSVPDTAAHLAYVLGEPVSITRLYRLVSEGHIVLSLNLLNGATVRRGAEISFSETVWCAVPSIEPNQQLPTLICDGFESMACKALRGIEAMPTSLAKAYSEAKPGYLIMSRDLEIPGDRWYRMDGEVSKVDGVWDLLPYGGGQIDLERLYQSATDGVELNLINLDGVYATSPDKRMIVNFQEEFGAGLGEFYPADSILDTVALVVRKENIEAFIESALEEPEEISAIASNYKCDGLPISMLKLHAWPIVDGNAETVINALNRNSSWVREAIVGLNPKMINPAMLAYLLQSPSKDCRVTVRGNRVRLNRHLQDNFPEYVDAYEGLLELAQ